MMRPKTSTLIFGYPLVTVPLVLLHGGFGIYYTWSVGFDWMTFYCLLVVGWLTNCANEAGRYRAWRREWDALDPDHEPMRPLRTGIRWIAAVATVIGAFWLYQHHEDAVSVARLLMPLLLIGLPVLLIANLVLRLGKSRRPKPQEWIVSQAISRPLPAPTVAEAYARLPDYCRSAARKEHT